KKEVIMEVPQYTLRPNTNAMVAPRILMLIGLAALFYVGIYINAKLAVGVSIPPVINLVIFACLIVMVAVQVILYRVKFSKYKYMFYTNRIEFEGKKPLTFLFNDFQEAAVKQGLFDRMFGTGEIKLSKSFVMGPVGNVAQVKTYLEQLVQYHRAMEQRYRMQSQQATMQKEVSQQAQQAQPAAGTGAYGSGGSAGYPGGGAGG
ncbi:hypothetical protein KY359_06225, partial [Candidatus Woesearchaeota archaeon]|nr:hypothetical protein [Candidatus Woesearchaeota archaeon]